MLPRLPLLVLVLVPLGMAEGQQKKTDKDGPKVIGTAPLGAGPGATVKLTIRGLKLDTATEVRVADVPAKILGKSKVMPPNQVPATLVGDTQVQIEWKLPADAKSPSVPLVVVTPDGTTAAHTLLVDAAPLVGEKEPNNGFRQAQPVQVDQVIDGSIAQNQDVDVFRLEGKAGQRLVVEVLANRHGSPLDALLTLHDAAGAIIASDDDGAGQGTDSRLAVTLPRTGAYFLTLLDAHDLGGPTHVYRLRISADK